MFYLSLDKQKAISKVEVDMNMKHKRKNHVLATLKIGSYTCAYFRRCLYLLTENLTGQHIINCILLHCYSEIS